MIYLSSVASKAIAKIKAKENLDPTVPIRIGIKGGGCAGFTYTFAFDAKKSRFDLEFESEGVKILVDKKSHLYINGTEIGWNDGLIDHGLRFTNPSAKGSCGCGTSFIFEPKQNTKTDLPVFGF